MKKVLVRVLVVGALVIGALATGIGMSFIREAKSNAVQAVQCQEVSVGYTYEKYVPEYLPVGYMDEFEAYIWDMYISEYCVNYCGTCDSYSYEHCLCCECTDDSECSELDYQLFIEDNMEAIADEYYEWLSWIQEDYREMNYVVYEF